MAHTIVMPRLGDDMTDGKIVNWLKREGDTVSPGEVIAEVETDKVTLDIESPTSGVVQRILVREGESAPVGGELALVLAVGEQVASSQSVASPSAAPISKPVAAPTSAALPRVSPTARPDTVAVGQGEHPAPVASVGRYASASPGPAHVSLGTPAPAALSGGLSAPAGESLSAASAVKASPVARRLAEEYGLDLAIVRGTGPGGRVTRDDVLPHLLGADRPANAAPGNGAPGNGAPGNGQEHTMPAAVLTTPLSPAPPRPADDVEQAGSGLGNGTDHLLTRRQLTMARRMVESKTQIPHLYLIVEVDVTEALLLRQQLNGATDDGVKISVNDLIVKATARALTRYPILTARFAGDHLTLPGEVSIAVAVALDDGLVTPVVRQADQKSLGHIATEIREMAERARTGKGRVSDYEGGTFTVSNLGMYGIDTVVPIINPPQAAILGVGMVRRIPVYEGDTLVPRDRLNLAVSADHRITDGATVARFLNTISDLLAHPLRLLI